MTSHPASRSRRASISRGPGRRGRGAFTLIEILVVLLIIMLVSAVALPTVLSAISHRQVSEAARVFQGAIAGARDAAIHAGAPRGIRLIPDPAFTGIDPTTGFLDSSRILAYSRIVPIEPAPDYSEGALTIRSPAFIPTTLSVPYPVRNADGSLATSPFDAGSPPTPYVLMVEQSVYGSGGSLNSPTSWFWNVRIGDKIQIGTNQQVFTVVGPMVVGPTDGNSELFVNNSLPGHAPDSNSYVLMGPPASPTVAVEYLFLVNGQDDNNNGITDEGWDGVNNNLNFDSNSHSLVDDFAEWEYERWPETVVRKFGAGSILNQSYTIHRRPVPSPNVREVDLPPDVVIDATTWGNASPERSRLGAVMNTYTGVVDILLTPQGDLVPTTVYSTPSSLTMANAFVHFWLAERADLFAPQAQPKGSSYKFTLPMSSDGGLYDAFVAGHGGYPTLKGEMRLITLFARTGQLNTVDAPTFDVNNLDQPYIGPQQGVRGGR